VKISSGLIENKAYQRNNKIAKQAAEISISISIFTVARAHFAHLWRVPRGRQKKAAAKRVRKK